MREIAFITRSLHQLKTVFRQQPLEILLLTVFSVPFLLLDYNGFLRQHFAYWLFYPIYFAVIYLLRPHRILYWISPFLLGTMTFLLVVNFGDNLNVYSTKPEYWGMLLIALICLLSQGWQKTNKDYVSHVVNRGANLFLLAPIPAYLCLAAFAITLTTTTYLFGLKSGFDYMWNKIFLFCTFGLVPLFFLLFEKQGSERDFNRFAEILINFILSPALIIYSIILYLYLAKIGISMELPKGNLSFIVLPYLAAGIALSALQTLLTKPRWRWFYRLLPYIFLAPLVLLWIGIYERISTYGLTELRIYLLSIALTLTAFCVLSLWKKLLQYRYLAMIAIVAVFITTVVINPKQIEFNSQNWRLSNELYKLGVLDEKGRIKADFDLKREMKYFTRETGVKFNELANLADYLYRQNNQIEQHYGEVQFTLLRNFYYDSYYSSANTRDKNLIRSSTGHFFASLDTTSIDLTGYRRIIFLKGNKSTDNTEIIFEGKTLTSFDISEFVREVMRKNNLRVDERHLEDDFLPMEQQFTRIETKEGTVIFPKITICYDSHKKHYAACSAEEIIFLEK